MYPIYLSNGCDDNTKYDELIIAAVMQYVLLVACPSTSALSDAHRDRTISYRAVQLHMIHAEEHFTKQHVMKQTFYHFCNRHYSLSAQLSK